MDDKLSNFVSRIEGKGSSLSLRVEKMEDRIDILEKSRRSPSPKTRSTSPLTCYGCGSSGHFISQCPERGVKSRTGWGSRGCPTIHSKDNPPQEVLHSTGQETKRDSRGSRSCTTGCPKDSPAQEVLNPNGLDPPYEPQRMVNQNGLDPPRQLRKVVNPNGLDPPDQLKPKDELDLVASEGTTGMQNQEIASGGEQSIICTRVRNVQSQEVVPAYTIRTDVGNLSVDAIVDTAAEITVISEEVYRLSGKRRVVQKAGKGQASWANLVGPISVKVETIYVAQINDDMLLGVDYLDKYNAVIDFEDHTLQVQGEQIPLRTLVSDRRSKAYLKQRCLNSPMSARRVGCQINTPLAGTILIEPRNGHDLIIPWVICKDQDTWIAQGAGAGAAAKRGPGTPVTTGVARVGNVAVIGRKAPARDPVKAAIGDVMDKKDTPTTRGLGRMG
ncbi:DNA damage-inducible protein 1 [Plakobranchus ocellatus]|uniref:DNA damage-inducible protein 1 n=1 Tax=Plakobranchus ocellatus TaxID=259542 RepID=A0AAV4BNB1_9GAST|nr:DNA damage-inducible protein 1 [Plakobranchus ocellatus]